MMGIFCHTLVLAGTARGITENTEKTIYFFLPDSVAGLNKSL